MKCEILPDLASNWNSMLEIYRMINRCKKSGIKFAKLQMFKKEQVRDVYWNNIITKDIAKKAFDFGVECGVNVYFTPCYPEAVDICEDIGVGYYKVRYKDKNNKEIFNKLKNIKKPIFVSCDNIRNTLYYGMKNVICLYCIHRYPAKIDDYQGFLMEYFQDNPELGLFPKGREFTGISDHTPDLIFFRHYNRYFKYWEMHMALRKGTIEERWSKTFNEVEEL